LRIPLLPPPHFPNIREDSAVVNREQQERSPRQAPGDSRWQGFCSRRVMSNANVAIVLAAVTAAASACAGGSSSSTTAPTAVTITGTGSTTVTYVKDIQPILASDCVSCHSGAQPPAGVNLSTYAGVLSVVTIGSTSSKLIQVTQPGGLMYSMLSGDRTTKARTIYDWIMTSSAAQQ
jgi:hypothetical protein